MKKIYLLLGLVSYQSFSQDFAKTSNAYTKIDITVAKTPVEDRQTTVFLKRNGEYVKAYLNNLPSAVMADFARKFEDADGITWKVDDNDVTGYFTQNGQKIVVTYKKSGQLVSTRKTYQGNHLPKNIRSFIQSDLSKDYQINMVTEVVGETVTLWEINLTKLNNISIVRLSKNKDGEPELTERITYVKVASEGL